MCNVVRPEGFVCGHLESNTFMVDRQSRLYLGFCAGSELLIFLKAWQSGNLQQVLDHVLVHSHDVLGFNSLLALLCLCLPLQLGLHGGEEFRVPGHGDGVPDELEVGVEEVTGGHPAFPSLQS